VNDDLRFRIVIKEMIWSKYPELEIIEADNVNSAIDEAKNHQPDLIILDIDFDVDNRYQLIRDLKSYDPKVNILALSGSDALEYRQAALKNGADHFLSKFSSSGKQIIDLIESVLFES
jgi:DNA-binding NarL/FixJ family response regulator